MRRIGLVALVTLLFVWRAQAQQLPAGGETPTPANYLPLIINSGPTLTPTNTATATATQTRTPTNTATPTNTPTLPPPSFNNCQADPNPGAAPNYPVRIVAIDKAAETVTLRNVSNTIIDLSDWTMCSITGNQEHIIGGPINPGQTLLFGPGGGPIWNNTTDDDGALYNEQGQLASYFADS